MTIDEARPTPDLKDGKANFDTIYNGDDPRKYYRELGNLGYEIPHHGQQVFSPLVAARRRERGRTEANVLDLCCSYGINAALLTCDLTMADLEEHYRIPEVSGLSSEELLAVDQEYFATHRLEDAPTVAGLDISERAIGYARAAGLLANGAVENLEEAPASVALAEVVAETDIVTVTGGIGYITAKTFGHLFDVTSGDHLPWVAAFTLRQFSYHDIADVLAERGLVTERLVGRTFPQRRFSCDEERDFTLRHLDESGLDVVGREADGSFHAEFYLSRPADEVAEHPLSELLPSLAGGGSTMSTHCGHRAGEGICATCPVVEEGLDTAPAEPEWPLERWGRKCALCANGADHHEEGQP
jgi:SAM-dependent methyltransferase